MLDPVAAYDISIEALQFYEDHPIEFCEDLIGVELDVWQKRAFNALVKDHFIAIRAGSGVGKTVWLSLASMWFLSTKPFSKIPTTAPSQHQLSDLLWGEHHKWISRSTYLQRLLAWTQTKVSVRGYEPQWYAVARTARVSPDGQVAEGLQGFHAEENLLYIVDEACHDDQTEVQTKTGWKLFKDVLPEDLVLTMNPKNMQAEWIKPTAYIKHWYEDEMYQGLHRTCDFCVTPNHKMMYWSRQGGDWRMRPYKDVGEGADLNMLRQYRWEGDDEDEFVIPRYETDRRRFEAVTVSMKKWASFLGWYLSEGSITDCAVTMHPKTVVLSQRDSFNKVLMLQAIDDLGFDYQVYDNEVHIYAPHLGFVLSEYGQKPWLKFVPQYIKDANIDVIRSFLAGYLLGDGYVKSGKDVYYTSSKRMADDLQELIQKTGCAASVLERPEEEAKWYKDHWIKSKRPQYVVSQYIKGGLKVVKSKHVKKVQYKGYVYCLEVEPYHTLFTRRNGFCMWSGNSGVADAVFPAVEGALTGKKAYAILAANPTRLSGYFYDVFNNMQMRGMYQLFHVSCYDSKYVEERYINMMRARYGEDHPIFQIKVLGDFPASDVMLLFSPADIEAMRNNILSSEYDLRKIRDGIEIGLDIGRTSSRSIMCIRAGLRIIEWAEKFLTGGIVDTVDITNWVIGYIQSYEPEAVKVDAIGIGAGVYDNLRRLYPKIIKPVAGNAACAPDKKDRFANLRAQGYWELRMILPEIYCRNLPERLIVELGDVKYRFPNGKILIESKEDMMNRIGRSPDHLDALVYAFLDSSICIDSYRNLAIPINITAMNNSLVKQSIWANTDKRVVDRNYSRWEQLHA